jgi:dTDP-4-dehydrorhamnose 3,5-epimerase
MNVERLAIPEVMLFTPKRFSDERGFFFEAWAAAKYAEAELHANFIQDNQSRSHKGVVRGLHCQIAPHVQGKLVRVLNGAIWDVAVDIRKGSPTFGQHVSAILSAENGCQLWIPGGFLHGFCALEEGTDVLYKVDGSYDRGSERGVAWNDPDLALPWPLAPGKAIVSAKDQVLPRLAECEPWYSYQGA